MCAYQSVCKSVCMSVRVCVIMSVRVCLYECTCVRVYVW